MSHLACFHLLILISSLAVFGWSDFAIINTDNYEDMEVEQDLMLQDKSGAKLNLRLHYQFVSFFPRFLFGHFSLSIRYGTDVKMILVELSKFRFTLHTF